MVAGIPRNNVSTDKSEWCTPPKLYKQLDEEFHFDIDAACNVDNCLCPFGLAIEYQNSLETDWCNLPDFKQNPIMFLNPPYGRGIIEAFMKKAFEESQKGATVVCLVPFNGAGWFKKYCLRAAEMRIVGRVKYVGHDLEGNPIENSPTFDSCIVVFLPGDHQAKLKVF
jgi:phage N-6-adenine-methyltransferase